MILGGYAWRDFSLGERLLTEARVLWFYLHMIVLPNLGEMGLHHDDFLISRGPLSPGPPCLPRPGYSCLRGERLRTAQQTADSHFRHAFFFVGHAMESTIIPLELVLEHRNYLPMLASCCLWLVRH
ncbi:MAG: hypothetical protein IPN64_12105 [Propionivibrio sp.]|nr:hypothetical protein [Propionivibrio sp.]